METLKFPKKKNNEKSEISKKKIIKNLKFQKQNKKYEISKKKKKNLKFPKKFPKTNNKK